MGRASFWLNRLLRKVDPRIVLYCLWQGLKPNIRLIAFIGPPEVGPLLQSLEELASHEFSRIL
jgi:hypothetical protein